MPALASTGRTWRSAVPPGDRSPGLPRRRSTGKKNYTGTPALSTVGAARGWKKSAVEPSVTDDIGARMTRSRIFDGALTWFFKARGARLERKGRLAVHHGITAEQVDGVGLIRDLRHAYSGYPWFGD